MPATKATKAFFNRLVRSSLVLAAGTLAASMAIPAHAASLRKALASEAASTSGSPAGDPGSVLYGYFDVSEPSTNNGTGNGDNVMRLINTTAQDMCALIYVFDADEELGECCGCPLTANEVINFGITNDPYYSGGITDNLTTNWREASEDQQNGVIAVVGATALSGCINNGSPSNYTTPNPACNAGCDPTIRFVDGVLVQSSPSGQGLNGAMLHNQRIGAASGILEVNMFDDSPGDATNIGGLQDLCRNAIQRGSGKGWCTCPHEFGDLIVK